MTLIIATHDTRVAAQARRVIELIDGRMVQTDEGR
jgi:ABC-type lipoprotein export system ATPase subunit